MPVRRLRSLQDAETTLFRDPKDPLFWPTIATVWGLAERLCPPRFPPGLHKHRTIDEANRQTEAWEAAAIRSRRK
ncbi:MAG: hypothetical protein EXR72_17490 [Myxococcales bacterium]|nr:hypothetical protein [Myxococcales bacterium]